jgi:NADH:ubiquinone oxidoreductase subunit E
MPVETEPIEIVICLGSSCFARGNAQNLGLIEEFITNHSLKVSVRLSGKLCQDACKLGPNLTIAGEDYHEVTAAKLREILEQLANRPTEAE